MVSRFTIRSDVMKIYTSEKKRLHMELEKIPSRVSFTIDMWYSYRNQWYLCLTAHYIDESWKLQKRIHSFIYVSSPHTGEVIATTFLDLLVHWKLENKLFIVTLENVAYNDVAASSLQRQLYRNSFLVLEGKMFHVRCCAHILNIIVQDGLKSIGVAVHKIREGIKYITGTQARQERFNETISLLRIESKKNICLDVPTRGNSTSKMLDVALALMEAFHRFAQDEFSPYLVPSESEWEYWKIFSLVLAIAVVIDARYNLKLVQFYYSKIYGNDAEHQVNIVRDGIYDLFKDYESNKALAVKEGEKSNKIEKLTRDFLTFINEESSNLSTKSELDLYLEEHVFPFGRLQYPKLVMAREVLVIHVSTIASESAFSTVGRILDDYHSSLKPETVQALICAKDWLRNEVKGRK
ncbi:hypothetical protein AMTRI_Chr03g47970 [Amborella trichopoda]